MPGDESRRHDQQDDVPARNHHPEPGIEALPHEGIEAELCLEALFQESPDEIGAKDCPTGWPDPRMARVDHTDAMGEAEPPQRRVDQIIAMIEQVAEFAGGQGYPRQLAVD